MKLIIDKIIHLITTLPTESVHADYEKIIKPYHDYFNNPEFVTYFFSAVHDRFVKYKISHDVYARSENLTSDEIFLLEKRIELLLFIFDFLLPKYEHDEKNTDMYLHLLWMDMTCLFSAYNLRFYSNPIEELQNHKLIKTVKKYRSLFLDYQERYVRLINDILNHEASHLEQSVLLNIKSNLRYGFISIIVNEFHYACHLQLLGDINGASECLERARIYLDNYTLHKVRIFEVSQASLNDILLVDKSMAQIKAKINHFETFARSILEMVENIYVLANQHEYEAVEILDRALTHQSSTVEFSSDLKDDFDTFMDVSHKMCSALSSLSDSQVLFSRLEAINGFPEVFFIPELHILKKALPKEQLLEALEISFNSYKELGRFFETVEPTGLLNAISDKFKTLSLMFKESREALEKSAYHPATTELNPIIISNTISYLEGHYIKQLSIYEVLAINLSQNENATEIDSVSFLDSLLNKIIETNSKITIQANKSLLEREPKEVEGALDELTDIIETISKDSKMLLSIEAEKQKSIFKQLATVYITLRKYFNIDLTNYQLRLINNRFSKLARYCFDCIQILDLKINSEKIDPASKFLKGVKIAPALTFQASTSSPKEKSPLKEKVLKKSPPKQTFYFPPVPNHSRREITEVKTKKITLKEEKKPDYFSFGSSHESSSSKKVAKTSLEVKKPSKAELKALKKEKKSIEVEAVAFKQYANAVLPLLEVEEEEEIISKIDQLDLNDTKNHTKIESILIPESIKDILMKLNHGGYRSYLYGGFVRDSLLKIQANDYDIVTNNPNVDMILGPKCLKMLHKKDSYKFSSEVDISFDAELNLSKLAESRDLKLNAFFADVEGQVSDPLNYYSESLLKSPNLEFIGDLFQRLSEDPSRMLRIVRLSFHIKKLPPEFFLAHFQNLGDLITSKLPFGIYAKQLENLFTTKDKSEIVNYFINNKIFSCFLPTTLRGVFNEKNIIEYYTFLNSLISDPEFKKPKINRYHILALLLLPLLLKNRDCSPAEIVSLFCNAYLGPDMKQEKALIVNRTGALLTNYLGAYSEFCKPKTFTPSYQTITKIINQGDIQAQVSSGLSIRF
jgi:hypothetical protein